VGRLAQPLENRLGFAARADAVRRLSVHRKTADCVSLHPPLLLLLVLHGTLLLFSAPRARGD